MRSNKYLVKFLFFCMIFCLINYCTAVGAKQEADSVSKISLKTFFAKYFKADISTELVRYFTLQTYLCTTTDSFQKKDGKLNATPRISLIDYTKRLLQCDSILIDDKQYNSIAIIANFQPQQGWHSPFGQFYLILQTPDSSQNLIKIYINQFGYTIKIGKTAFYPKSKIEIRDLTDFKNILNFSSKGLTYQHQYAVLMFDKDTITTTKILYSNYFFRKAFYDLFK